MSYYIKKIKDKLKNSQSMENAVYFSIIVPVYNTEKYLSRCLDSIVYQSFDDMEIIIVDDCSEGNCFEIVEEYQKNNRINKNIKYIRNEENLGSAWSRLNGLSEATGKYIHFVDSNDLVFEDMFVNDSRRRTLWCRIFRKKYLSIADDWILNLFTLFFVKQYRSISDVFYYYFQDNLNAMMAVVENKKDVKFLVDKLYNTLR